MYIGVVMRDETTPGYTNKPLFRTTNYHSRRWSAILRDECVPSRTIHKDTDKITGTKVYWENWALQTQRVPGVPTIHRWTKFQPRQDDQWDHSGDMHDAVTSMQAVVIGGKTKTLEYQLS